jgi:hypothetical protein
MKPIFCLLFLTVVSFTSMSQVNFSGNWKINTSKSTLNTEFSMAPDQLILTQSDSILTVERHSNFQGESLTFTDKIYLDGKESINTGWMDSKKKSIAAWSDDKVSLKISTKIPMEGGDEMKLTETFQLDNGMLKIVSVTSSSWGESSETYLLDKQ